MHLFIARFFPTALSGQSLVKNIGSLEADAKLISIMNSRVWKALLDRCAGTEDGGARAPRRLFLPKNRTDTNTVSGNVVSQHGFVCLPHLLQKHYSGHLDRRTPSGKEKTNKCVCVLSSPNTFGSGIRMKNPYLVTFQVYSRRTEGRGKRNYENKSTKGAILFLFCPCLLFI